MHRKGDLVGRMGDGLFDDDEADFTLLFSEHIIDNTFPEASYIIDLFDGPRIHVTYLTSTVNYNIRIYL